ncbi:MAG: zf-HC2 domain-containing protein [Gemmatimonadaceae bacterium]|nr:zf-HC2 domain-containing protein [Gemmatimonadaceae bacterium]
MTNPTFSCDAFDAVFADWLDDTLAPDARARAEAHRTTCDRCRALADDVLGIIREAPMLPAPTPTRDLWPGIAERIAPRVLPMGTPVPAATSPAADWRRQLAAAAALVAVSVTGTWYVVRSGGMSARPGVESVAQIPGQPKRPRPIVVSRPSAEETYASEVAVLEQALAERANKLDPTTVDVITKNLAIIDAAIREAKAALSADPANQFLEQQLSTVLGRKLELMRRAALLPSRT